MSCNSRVATTKNLNNLKIPNVLMSSVTVFFHNTLREYVMFVYLPTDQLVQNGDYHTDSLH